MLLSTTAVGAARGGAVAVIASIATSPRKIYLEPEGPDMFFFFFEEVAIVAIVAIAHFTPFFGRGCELLSDGPLSYSHIII